MNTVIIKRKVLLAMIANTAKDDIRYAINGIEFEFDKDGTHIIATDGHRMVIVESKEERFDAANKYRIGWKDLKRALSGLSNKEYVRFAFRSNTVAIECGRVYSINRGPEKWHRAKECDTRIIVKLDNDGTYPKWQDIIPKNEDLRNGSLIQVNAKYLYEMSQVVATLDFASSDESLHGISILQSKGDESNAIVVRPLAKYSKNSGGWTFTGIIMPIRQ